MIVRYNHINGSQFGTHDFDRPLIRIGYAAGNDVTLGDPAIANRAAEFCQGTNGWTLHVLNGEPIAVENLQYAPTTVLRGMSHEVRPNDVFRFGAFELELDLERREENRTPYSALNEFLSSKLNELHQKTLDENFDPVMSIVDEQVAPEEKEIQKIEKFIDERIPFYFFKVDNACDYLAGLSVRDELYTQVFAGKTSAEIAILLESRDKKFNWSRLRFGKEANIQKTLEGYAKKISQELGVEKLLKNKKDNQERIYESIDRHYWNLWYSYVKKINADIKQGLARRYVIKALKDSIYGYGPLEDLLRLPGISEIMLVNSFNPLTRDVTQKIYVEKDGMIEDSGRIFFSQEDAEKVVRRIASSSGRSINVAEPILDTRLRNGSRVNAVLKPISIDGPTLTIRLFPNRGRLNLDELVRCGSLSEAAVEFLRASVGHRCNIIVSGGTGTGKTTLLNALCEYIDNAERIVTIEDTAELQVKKKHCVRLETRRAGADGKGGCSIGDLVVNSLRMRPDRIIVGECRGGEALDMLQAMNTGHDGSLTTIHANSPHDVILRLEVMVQKADGKLPNSSIHRQISSGVDLIVQLQRRPNGKRIVSHISEVTDIDPDTREVRLSDIFVLENDDDDTAQLVPTGRMPTFLNLLLDKKLIRSDLFYSYFRNKTFHG